METKKTTLLIAIFIILAQGLIAVKPEKDYTKGLAKRIVTKLSEDVILTDSQKVVIQAKADAYELKCRNYNSEADTQKKNKLSYSAFIEYRTFVDSILKPEQRDTLKSRMIKKMMKECKKNKLNKISN